MSEDDTITKVGIGASAGGLEAIQRLVSNLNNDNGFAYFIVMHLAPDKESNLVEIISRSTSIPVVLAKNDVKIEKDHIYVIPPNMNMSLRDNYLRIEPFESSVRPHLTINYFLDSLAQESHEKSIGVILSGTGADGSLGLRAVKEQGGITFAQSVESAQYSQMPYQAAMTGNVDFVLSPESIANEMNRLGKNFSIIRKADEIDRETTNRKIISLLRRRFKIDFSKYKDSTFNRRVLRRVILGGFQGIDKYYDYLLRSQKEQHDMLSDLLINVTEFFRDSEAYDALKEKIYPSMIQNAKKSESLRVWVVGCSTGEEVYSIAISLVEVLDDMRVNKPIKIFGTDVNPTAVKQARQGSYPESISLNVSQERLNRFFTKTSGGYEISKRIREMCVFAEHNVLMDPPFANMNLISCRNLMIYLDTETQEALLPIFHYSLKPSGYLFLGKSETVGRLTDLFKVEDSKYKIYSKRFTTKPPQMPNWPIHPVTHLYTEQNEYSTTHGEPRTLVRDLMREADSLLIKEYAPSGVIVNDEFDIIQFRGDTGKYLSNPPGTPSLNIVKMMTSLNGIKIQSALREVRETGLKKIVRDLKIDEHGLSKYFDAKVSPLKTRKENEKYFLIIFNDRGDEELPTSMNVVPQSSEEIKSDEVKQLQDELAETKEYLQNYMEESESYNEELISSHEELQSSYEELQSVNEELETTREELQASNEELSTMNEELQSRVIELNHLYNDLNNLVNSVDIPIVIVDSDLKIRRVTPKVGELLNMRAVDVGRSIEEINLNIDIPEFKEILYDAIEGVSTHQMEVQDSKGKWYSFSVKPYKTSDRRIDGAVLVFVDISEVKKNKIDIKRLETIRNLTDDAVIIVDAEEKILGWNKIAEEMHKVFAKEIIGKNMTKVFPRKKFSQIWELYDKAKYGESFSHVEFNSADKANKRMDILVSVYPIEEDSGLINEIVIIERNITKIRELENEIALLEKRDEKK